MVYGDVLCKATIDVVVDRRDSVGGVDSDGRRLTLLNFRKGRHIEDDETFSNNSPPDCDSSTFLTLEYRCSAVLCSSDAVEVSEESNQIWQTRRHL